MALWGKVVSDQRIEFIGIVVRLEKLDKLVLREDGLLQTSRRGVDP